MMVRIAELEIDPAQLTAYLGYPRVDIEASLALERGVCMLKAVSLRDSLSRVRLLEVYESPEAYAEHIRLPHFLKYKVCTAHMVLSLRLLDADPIAF